MATSPFFGLFPALVHRRHLETLGRICLVHVEMPLVGLTQVGLGVRAALLLVGLAQVGSDVREELPPVGLALAVSAVREALPPVGLARVESGVREALLRVGLVLFDSAVAREAGRLWFSSLCYQGSLNWGADLFSPWVLLKLLGVSCPYPALWVISRQWVISPVPLGLEP